MGREVDTARRLVKLQRRVAEQRRLALARCRQDYADLAAQGDAVAETLDGGGLAWQIFPDMSTRYLSKLVAEKNAAAQAVQAAVMASSQEGKRLDILDKRLALSARTEGLRQDDQERLERAAQRTGSSLRQA